MMTRPLALTDRQLAQLRFAAKAVPPHARGAFLRTVANRLAGEVSDAAVQVAINVALDALPAKETIA
jgi:hypothetical protein